MGTDTLTTTLWDTESHGYRHIGYNTGTQHHTGTDTLAATFWNTESHRYRHIGDKTLEHRITWVQTHWLQHSGTQNHMGTDTLATTLWNTASHRYRHIGYNTWAQSPAQTQELFNPFPAKEFVL